MSKKIQKQTEADVNENTVKKLSWRMAERDDKKVARQIYEGGEIDEVYGLDECGLLDGFYSYLEEKGVFVLLEKISGAGIKRVMVPFFQFVHLYMLKILFGVEAISALPQLLFSNEGAMRLAGFNAREIENGVCERGKKKKQQPGNRGPICDDALARNIVKIPLTVIEQFFNAVVKLLAKQGVFPERLAAVIDPTDIQTTEKYKGCGSVTRKKRVRDKEGKLNEIEITVWGWKLMVVFYGKKKLPLAAKLLKIQNHESKYTIELIKLAQKNIAPYSKIVRIVMDRGHLDGEDLWWLAKAGIEFVIPAKGNMDVAIDARALAEEALKRNGGYIQTRIKKIRRGNGKNSYVEKVRTTVVGIKGLTTYDQYGPAGWDKDATKKTFRGNKINTAVVCEWEGKNYGRDKWTVYLTNMRINKPLKAFDDYDERSIIENCLFKEAKTGWHIKHAPEKTEEAMLMHVFFTLAVFGLTNAYREWSKEQEAEELIDEEIPAMGIRRWRQEIKRKGKNKAIVFIEDTYGIFYLAEIMILSGVRVKKTPRAAGTSQEILRRYGLDLFISQERLNLHNIPRNLLLSLYSGSAKLNLNRLPLAERLTVD